MGTIIDIIKFLFSSDLRDSFKSVFKIAKKSKDWEKDIKIYKGSFNIKTEYKLQALVGYIHKNLKEKDWDYDNISSMDYIITELVRNGIEHSKSNKDVKVEIEVSSSYLRMIITDFGKGFDLSSELKKQDALLDNSRKSKALSVIYKMSTTLQQDKNDKGHKIIATLIKGYKSCQVYLIDDVTIFEFNSEVSFEGYFWSVFINTLKSIKVNDKIIIYFNDLNKFASSAMELVIKTVYKDELVFSDQEQDTVNEEIFLQKRENIKSSQVIVCGENNLNYVLKGFLNSNFEYFENIDDGINYFKSRKKKSSNKIHLSPPKNWSDKFDVK